MFSQSRKQIEQCTWIQIFVTTVTVHAPVPVSLLQSQSAMYNTANTVTHSQLGRVLPVLDSSLSVNIQDLDLWICISWTTYFIHIFQAKEWVFFCWSKYVCWLSYIILRDKVLPICMILNLSEYELDILIETYPPRESCSVYLLSCQQNMAVHKTTTSTLIKYGLNKN